MTYTDAGLGRASIQYLQGVICAGSKLCGVGVTGSDSNGGGGVFVFTGERSHKTAILISALITFNKPDYDPSKKHKFDRDFLCLSSPKHIKT